MFTIFAFLLSTIGCINWLMIGFFQYDFIAGLFGFQASIFSRFFYILFGLSSLILVFKLIKGKGVIAVFSRKNKKNVEENIQNIQNKMANSQNANTEASKDILDDDNQSNTNNESRFENFDQHYRK